MQSHNLTRSIIRLLAKKIDMAAEEISEAQAYMEADPRLREMADEAFNLVDALVCMNMELMAISKRPRITLLRGSEQQHQLSPDG